MGEHIDKHISSIFGLDVKQLLEVKKKLQILGIEMSDLVTFLDRDKVQLFAEQQVEIGYLKSKIKRAEEILRLGDK